MRPEILEHVSWNRVLPVTKGQRNTLTLFLKGPKFV